jgi:serine protease AprX
MICFKFSARTRAIAIMTLLFASTTCFVNGQETIYSYYYRVYLRDKGDNITGKFSAQDLLSSRAVSRRLKAGIKVPDFRDFPVNKSYLNIMTQLGLKLHTTSKWMNTALFKSQSAFDINILLSLPFVSNVKIVKTPVKNSGLNKKLDFQIQQTEFPPYDRQLTMINGIRIHDSGYDGKNILIAILDGGFLNSDVISSLSDLRSRKGIRKTYDFVKNNESVYNASTHGTAVLSVLAGKITGQIEGSAPGADYLLLKTEDVESEFACEEDFWAAGAEFADSSGVDIISSSLGYFNFDDPSLNYKYSDLDGNTAFVTRVADIAASKGILVVNSAGNERDKVWKSILFPSDGDSVVAVGAVDGYGIISDFSSSGPAADGRIKPDNVAMGVSVTVQVAENLIGRSNGTSFSCPVLSGIAACLLQAVPPALNTDIINVLHSSADRYNFPDSLFGYGIPDIVLALGKLQEKYIIVPEEGIIMYPNPTTGQFEITFSTPPEKVTIEIFSLTGELLFERKYDDFAGRSILITDLKNSRQGLYLVRVTDPSGIHVRRIIKLKN